jgi:hypothetical protein
MTTKALAVQLPHGVLAERPDHVVEGSRGTEGINTLTDVVIPQLKLAQGESKEVKRVNPDKFIDGLHEGEFFNSLTRKIYGDGPLYFMVIRQLDKRNIEFIPMAQGGGIKRMNVPDNDPGLEWGTGPNGKPLVTQFHNFLIFLLDAEGRHDTMTFSLKSSQTKKAKALNSHLLGSKVDTWTRIYSATAVVEPGKGQSFYGWNIQPAGWANKELCDIAEETYTMMTGQKATDVVEGIVKDVVESQADEEDAPF